VSLIAQRLQPKLTDTTPQASDDASCPQVPETRRDALDGSVLAFDILMKLGVVLGSRVVESPSEYELYLSRYLKHDFKRSGALETQRQSLGLPLLKHFRTQLLEVFKHWPATST